MKTKLLHTIIIILCAELLISGCAYIDPEPYVSETEKGMVEVFNGADKLWIYPEDNVPVNAISADDFIIDPDGNKVYCGGKFSSAVRGVDVSVHQGEIDWQQVADSGIKFAIIRAGGRSYGEEGELYEDDFFLQNLQGAHDAGLKVGVYFFSQARTAEEAEEEAQFTVDLLGFADIELPVFFDWEHIDGGRANEIDGETMTQCAEAFCETVEDAGFDGGIYFNLDTAYYGYTLARLTDYTFWCASIGDYPFCYYAHELWQYSFEGTVPGISTACDLNMMFIK